MNLVGMDLTGTLFNSTSGTIKMNAFSGSGSYSYPNPRSGKKDIVYNIEANLKYQVVSNIDQIGQNDHVMLIVNELRKTPIGDACGWGANPGQITAITPFYCKGYFNQVVLHELGHNLGLDHTNGGLMNATILTSTELSEEQKGLIVAKMGMGVEAKDGTYIQSKETPLRYAKDAKTQAQEFKKANVIR